MHYIPPPFPLPYTGALYQLLQSQWCHCSPAEAAAWQGHGGQAVRWEGGQTICLASGLHVRISPKRRREGEAYQNRGGKEVRWCYFSGGTLLSNLVPRSKEEKVCMPLFLHVLFIAVLWVVQVWHGYTGLYNMCSLAQSINVCELWVTYWTSGRMFKWNGNMHSGHVTWI